MKTKKKSVRKVPGVKTAGEVFDQMLEHARFFDYMAYGPDENPWNMEFNAFFDVKDNVRVDDDFVVIYDIMSCDAKAAVSIKKDTVEYKDAGTGYTYLFRFYGAPTRIENLKELVK